MIAIEAGDGFDEIVFKWNAVENGISKFHNLIVDENMLYVKWILIFQFCW